MQHQLQLWQTEDPSPPSECSRYLTEQLITYLGNKRALLDFISKGAELVQKRLHKRKLSFLDMFSGSGVVARFMRRHSTHIIANDLERYSATINRCYMSRPTTAELHVLHELHHELRRRIERDPRDGFISELYAPRDDEDVREGERVFYTRRNAIYLDTARQLIGDIPSELRPFFIAPLLSQASIHANTSGVFKGFYKNSATGVGQFGGNNRDALSRIKRAISLPFPVFSEYTVDTQVFQQDANVLAPLLPEVDLAYLDPPYNQHPYGSNYFMLNLIDEYRRPGDISSISGIPTDWARSAYNKPQQSLAAFSKLVSDLRARFILVSFNSEGFIKPEEMTSLLATIGKTDVLETSYNTFRGSRNLRNRNIHVKEYLFLVEKA